MATIFIYFKRGVPVYSPRELQMVSSGVGVQACFIVITVTTKDPPPLDVLNSGLIQKHTKTI